MLLASLTLSVLLGAVAGCSGTWTGSARTLTVDVFRHLEGCWSLDTFKREAAAGRVRHAQVWNGRIVFCTVRHANAELALDCAGPFELEEFTDWLDGEGIAWRELSEVTP